MYYFIPVFFADSQMPCYMNIFMSSFKYGIYITDLYQYSLLFLDCRRNDVIYIVRNLFCAILFSHSVLLISNRASAGILHGNWQFPYTGCTWITLRFIYFLGCLTMEITSTHDYQNQEKFCLSSPRILMQFWSLYLGPAVPCSESSSRIHYGTWRNSSVSYTYDEPNKFLYRYRKWSPCQRHEGLKEEGSYDSTH
jgi:hypothetical protein